MSDATYRVVLGGEAHGALTINDCGGALELSADASAGVLGRLGAEFTFPDQSSAEAFTGWVERLSAELSLTEENREDIVSALVGLGVIEGSGSPTVTQGEVLPLIVDVARRSGTITAQTLDVSSSELLGAALSLKAPAVGGLGFRLGATTSTQDTTGAYYADEDGWQDWTNCFE